MTVRTSPLSAAQQACLVLLRTLVGWHFLYEGYVKLVSPAWSRAGAPLARWSAAGYLHAATGPLAPLFHKLAAGRALAVVDAAIPLALLLVGVALLLGIFTDAGCVLALALLAGFYAALPPLTGTHDPGAEGAYLVVNKTLIEAAAVLVLLAFGTGRIAGLDLLRLRAAQGKETTP